MIFAASLLSCRKDSISDGVRRVMTDEVSRFGFGERVETVAGCGAEGVFDVIELGTGFIQKCIGCRQSLAAALHVQQLDEEAIVSQ
jgi:hypothetical protein